MSSTILSLWRDNENMFANKTCEQIVTFAAEGKLRDGSETSKQFREVLSHVPPELLIRYVNECLSKSFSDAAFALQDVVNEIGSRLGFQIEHGRYRGTAQAIGYDGIWRSTDGYALIIEVKTTDAYRINLDTPAGYRLQLIAEDRVHKQLSSVLLIVGRFDTGDLEAQIRGSRHAWDVIDH